LSKTESRLQKKPKIPRNPLSPRIGDSVPRPRKKRKTYATNPIPVGYLSLNDILSKEESLSAKLQEISALVTSAEKGTITNNSEPIVTDLTAIVSPSLPNSEPTNSTKELTNIDEPMNCTLSLEKIQYGEYNLTKIQVIFSNSGVECDSPSIKSVVSTLKAKIQIFKNEENICLELRGHMSVNDEVLNLIADNIPKLISIAVIFDQSLVKLGIGSEIVGFGINHLLEKCSGLQSLHINHCKNLRFVDCKHSFLKSLTLLGASYADLGFLQFELPELESLEVETSSRNISKLCHGISSFCGKLTSLSISSQLINDNQVETALRNCFELQNLSFKDCRLLTDFSLAVTFPYLKNLKYLDLSQCNSIDDYSIGIIVSTAKQLESLRISQSPTVSGEAKLTDGGIGLLSGLASLKKLYFNSEAGNCKGLFNFAFSHLQLQHLDLSNCKNLTRIHLNCPKLEVLLLCGCKSLMVVANLSCPLLKVVGLSEMKKKTAQALKGLLEHHPNSVEYV